MANDSTFVLTQSGVVHRPDCGTVRHQVTRQDRPPEPGGHEHDFTGVVDEEGWTIVRERKLPDVVRQYEACYVTEVQLGERRKKYRRCRVCAPDVPAWKAPVAGGTAVTAKYLNESHVGRQIDGAGIIEDIRVVIRTSDGDVELGLEDQAIVLPRARPDE